MADDPKTDTAGTSPDTSPMPGPDAGMTPDQPASGEHAHTTGSEPGRPLGRDEIDPELIALPRPRTRIGPVLSVSVIVFCIFIMVRLRADLRFSLQEPAPRGFDSAAALLAAVGGDPGDLSDRLVQVRAVPDRTLAVHVAASLAEPGSRLTPVQGTGGTLWMMLDGSVWTAGIQYNEVYSGRLRRLPVLPFADKLRRHVADRSPMPRFVQADALRSALEAGASAVEDPAGDAVPVTADTPVQVYEAAGDRVRILAIASERLATGEAWAEALAASGLVAPGTVPVPSQPATEEGARQAELGAWVFTTTIPGGVDAARELLEKAHLSASAEPVRVVHEAAWRDLSYNPAHQGPALAVAGRQVPWPQVEWVALTVPRTVPANGDEVWVLLTEERPEAYWYVLPLFVVLGLFGLLFSWALVRSLWWDEDPTNITPTTE